MSKCNCDVKGRVPGLYTYRHAFDCPAHFDAVNRKLAGIYPAQVCMYCGKTACTCQEDRNKAARDLVDKPFEHNCPDGYPRYCGEQNGRFYDRNGNFFREGVDPRNYHGRFV